MTTIVQLWQWSVRRHRSRIIAVALLLGLGAGLVALSATSAKRTSTVFERLLEAGKTSDVQVTVLGPDVSDLQLPLAAALETAPVDLHGVQSAVAARPAGTDFFVPVDLLVLADRDDVAGEQLDRHILVEGRRPTPGASDEILMDVTVRDQLGFSVGQTIVFELGSVADADAFYAEGLSSFSGPQVPLTVVGATRDASTLDAAATPVFWWPRPVLEAVGPVGSYGESHRLKVTAGTPPSVVAGQIAGIDPRLIVSTSTASFAIIESSLRTTVVAATAVAVLLAALAIGVVGALVARVVDLATHDHDMLRVIGLTRRDRRLLVVMAVLPLSGIAAAVAVAVAWALAPLHLMGISRQIEPGSLRHVDVAVTAMAAAAAATLPVVIATLRGGDVPATQVIRHRRSSTRVTTSPRTLALRWFDARGSSHRRLHQTQLVALASAWTVAVSVAVITTSMHHLVDDPSLRGVSHESVATFAYASPDVVAEQLQTLRDDPDISRVDVAWKLVGTVDGAAAQIVVSSPCCPLARPTRGTGPGLDQIVLDTTFATSLGIAIGDLVTVSLTGGTRTLEVTGLGLLESGRTSAIEATLVDTGDFTDPMAALETYAALDFRPSSDRTAVMARIAEVADDAWLSADVLPPHLLNLRDADPALAAAMAFSLLLAASIAALGTMAVARRRGADLIAFRAMGATDAMVRQSIALYAISTTTAALVIGTGLGLLTGRVSWSAIAQQLGVLAEARSPWRAAAGVCIPVAIALLAAALAARQTGGDQIRDRLQVE